MPSRIEHRLGLIEQAVRAVQLELSAAQRAELRRLLGCSVFIDRLAGIYPRVLVEALNGQIPEPETWQTLRQQLSDSLRAMTAMELSAAQALIRETRQQAMLGIACRALLQHVKPAHTATELSLLAEILLQAGLCWVTHRLQSKYGQPRAVNGSITRLVVMAMGKLGGAELNFSSDVDLIFVYSAEGTTDGARPLANEEYFKKLVQQLSGLLQQETADGFALRIDLRLRPFGSVGPLASSMASLEHYYATHGREWERYAWVKARPIAGDFALGAEVITLLRPFVYRRYLDFGAIESLRELKQQIRRAVANQESDDLKRGEGGIRELEFLIQVLQLVHGGREPQLQLSNWQQALSALVEHGHYEAIRAQDLQAAYWFLRRVENCLQIYDDRQTHALPQLDSDWSMLACAMGYADAVIFRAELRQHRDFVAREFAAMFKVGDLPAEGRRIDLRCPTSEQLQALGYSPDTEVLADLQRLGEWALRNGLSDMAQRRISAVVVPLLAAARRHSTAGDDVVARRLLRLVRAVAGRSGYLVLLADRPHACERLAELFAASAWLADFTIRHPIILDELLLTRAAKPALSHAALHQRLMRMLVDAGDDGERQADAFRQFKQETIALIAAADLQGELSLMQVSDSLSWTAESVLDQAMGTVLRQLQRNHGVPGRNDDDSSPELLVVAYGKLGGYELAYGSDLDLVFLHDSNTENRISEGDKPLENSVYFARLVQRLISLLTTQTTGGLLYSIDTRLRPNGSSGLLVSSFAAFEQYQLEHAWTWEHQALIRARAIVGPNRLRRRFGVLRERVLGKSRDPQLLARQVHAMRQRMRSELDTSTEATFDLKQASGGIADIEFIVQYLVLAHAHHHPELRAVTDVVRLLDGLALSHVLSTDQVDMLKAGYFKCRQMAHRCALDNQPAHAPQSNLRSERGAVIALWQEIFADCS